MKKIIEGQLECFDSGGYEGAELIINNESLYNELICFENKKIKITIEEIKD